MKYLSIVVILMFVAVVTVTLFKRKNVDVSELADKNNEADD